MESVLQDVRYAWRALRRAPTCSDVIPTDPISPTVACPVLAICSLATPLLPTRLAANVDPTVALRYKRWNL